MGSESNIVETTQLSSPYQPEKVSCMAATGNTGRRDQRHQSGIEKFSSLTFNFTQITIEINSDHGCSASENRFHNTSSGSVPTLMRSNQRDTPYRSTSSSSV